MGEPTETARPSDLEREVAERRQVEKALRESEQRLRRALDATRDGIWERNVVTGETFYSNNYFRMLGYEPGELDLTYDTFLDLLHPEDREATAAAIARTIATPATEEPVAMEYRMRTRSGDWRWILGRGQVVQRDAAGRPLLVVGTHVDITERKQAEEELRQCVETQAVLLEEVNHRVSNNLAAIISILRKEKERVAAAGFAGFLPLLHDLEGRVRGLATVHRLLSASQWRAVELSELCRQVVKGTLQGVPPTTRIDLRVARVPVKLNSYQAHHLTLVLNELAINSVKHALQDRPEARIEVTIESEGEEVILRFRDDGPGFPGDLLAGDFRRAGIGYDLIRRIVERGLRGELALANDAGAVTTITFRNELESPPTAKSEKSP